MVMEPWKERRSGWSCVLGAFSCSKPQRQQMELKVPGAVVVLGTQLNHSVSHNQYWQHQVCLTSKSKLK